MKNTGLFLATGEAAWDTLLDTYATNVQKLLEDSLLTQATISEDHSVMKSGLPRKIEWILSYHGSNHYAPILPLITLTVLVCLGQAFEHVPNALAEVRCSSSKQVYI